MTSVYIANLSASTTHESLEKFMAFCGSIQHIDLHEGGKATVTFEKPSAASTALMLNGGTLDGSPIQVSSEHLDDEHAGHLGGASGSHDEHAASTNDDIAQEMKPRTAIVAEYLAHGYVLSDSIINKAVAFDQKHGISTRFLEYFRLISEQAKARTAELEAQTHIQTKAAQTYAQADEKVKLNEKAKTAWGIGKQYYSKVLASEFGQQAQAFYTSTSNTIMSVHEEASRIAADKKQASAAASSTSGTGSSVLDGGNGATAATGSGTGVGSSSSTAAAVPSFPPTAQTVPITAVPLAQPRMA